ncbi:MAG TPA: hypothetical protein VK361_04010 [Rubrobacteraceae bacterium]|nr:hypothetical protein [Rubrobacteraceae bacterium]
MRLRRADRQQGEICAGRGPLDLGIGHPFDVVEGFHLNVLAIRHT